MKHYELGEVVQFHTLPAEMTIVGAFLHPIDGKFYLVRSNFDITTAIQSAVPTDYEPNKPCYVVPAVEFEKITESVRYRQITLDDLQYFATNPEFGNKRVDENQIYLALHEGVNSVLSTLLRATSVYTSNKQAICIACNGIITNVMRLLDKVGVSATASFLKHTKI